MQSLNFLFISTDQQRWDTLGCYGSQVARTPHLDRLAAQGVRFDRCYTTNPVCMPARASWFTGQYPSHHGCWQNGVPLSPRSDLLQQRLNDAGYQTALIGKIHLDNVWLRRTPHPAYGFGLLRECEGDPYCQDEYFQWLDRQGLYDDYLAQFKAGGHHAGYVRRLPEDKHMNHWVTGHAEDYLAARAADGQPFFLAVGFFDPHHPFDPIEPYASQFDPAAMPLPPGGDDEAALTPFARQRRDSYRNHVGDPAKLRRTIAAYHATIAHVDTMVGRLLARLAALGLDQRTAVIFTSDHGELLGDHGMLHKGPFCYEPSIRVPLIWRLPAASGMTGLVDDGFASHVDLAPTVAALAGIAGPHLCQGQPLFGANGRLRPQPPRDAALVEWRERPFQSDQPFLVARCLVTDDWKYVYYHGQEYGELYDRRRDPHELHNRWDDPACQAHQAALHRRLLAFILEQEPCPPRTDLF